MPKWDNQKTSELFRVILALRTLAEAKKFFRDLLTEAEILEFGRRWEAAQMLAKQMPYSKIEAKTGLSSTTVARIAKWLKKGMGGYRLMIKRLSTTRHHAPSYSFGKGLS